jgi:hypothetical protein
MTCSSRRDELTDDREDCGRREILVRCEAAGRAGDDACRLRGTELNRENVCGREDDGARDEVSEPSRRRL